MTKYILLALMTFSISTAFFADAKEVGTPPVASNCDGDKKAQETDEDSNPVEKKPGNTVKTQP